MLALCPQVSIRHARLPADLAEVVAIFREYVISPTANLGFQDYEAEFAALPDPYAHPDGRLLLAWQDGTVMGCAALRKVDELRCELKRVYVRPVARGARVGRRLVESMMDEARAAAYRRMCLDVLPEFTAAQALYRSLGFTAAEPVSHNPIPGKQFLACDLTAPSRASTSPTQSSRRVRSG